MTQTQKNRSTLKRYAWLSIATALITMGMKAGAYLLTDSVGLLSDALESLVNLAGAIMVLSMLGLAVPQTITIPMGTAKRSISPVDLKAH